MLTVATQEWYKLLSPTEKSLVDTSVLLCNTLDDAKYPDYSFVVFPMAKAYEGFLKRFFWEQNLIDQEVYESRRFRIGRAFNPDLNSNQQDELWIFDDVAQACGHELTREMWEAWLECRNQVFHYFPSRYEALSLAAAEARLRQMIAAIEGATRCRLKDQPPVATPKVESVN